jgi:acyl-CoA synthetase (AMP-forming)/AMP-acid ligase II
VGTNGPNGSWVRSFKVPTVWLLVKSGGDVPRESRGKVDVRRLRNLLAEQG